MLLIITSTGDGRFSGININGLKWPWPPPPKIGGFSDFWRSPAAEEWIATKWMENEIDQDNPRTGFAIGSRASHEH